MTLNPENTSPNGRISRAAGAPLRVWEAENLFPDQAIYLDSPILSALKQILPFYENGIFSEAHTPVFFRRKFLVGAHLALRKVPENLDIRILRSSKVARIPVADGAVVFYPFNSQSNMTAVTNRRIHHVLTLHGESNKLASNRPAARIYDYVCVAGPLGRDRYLNAGIFTNADADGGRLVMMGDSFVQTVPWMRAAAETEGGALLYCPTWEGYGNGPDNYSSIVGLRGFAIAATAARSACADEVIVKPHPYLGLLQRRLMNEFVQGVRMLVRDGFKVRLAMDSASLPLKVWCKLRLSDVDEVDLFAKEKVPVSLGICDVSGMEAVFLKQGIRHMVVTREADIPESLEDFYFRKAILPGCDTKRGVRAYLNGSDEIDQMHCSRVFGWHDPALRMMTGSERRKWLVEFVRNDDFWKHGRSKKPQGKSFGQIA